MQRHALELPSAPPFLLAAALLLWGWQNDFLIFAVPMAFILETVHWVKWRWPITDKEFNNLTDLSGVGFFIVVVYVFIEYGAKGIYVILSLMPFILFLLLTVQLYSETGKIRLSALFVSLRKLDKNLSPDADRRIDTSLLYFVLCLLSASAGNQRTPWFFVLVCVVVAVVLYNTRPLRNKLYVWGLLFAFAVAMGYGGQMGLRNLQAAMERNFVDMFDRFRWRFRDPDRASTAIGTIGRLKFSDKILVRVKTDNTLEKTLYLREASYNLYNYGSWKTSESEFRVIDENLNDDSWSINDMDTGDKAQLAFFMLRENGVIPLPQGTEKISGPGIIEIKKNLFGTINMDIREGWIRYAADYDNAKISESTPTAYDLHVDDSYREDFDRLAGELRLEDMSAEQAVSTVHDFFTQNFYYSLERKRRYARGTYLKNFLFKDRTGHCEYFATSTALLLRSAGIPTRYAVGYATNEYSVLEGQYIARSRHAHSWVLAYVNNEWIRVDTTPAIWAPMDEENASLFQGISDLWAWISYQYDLWQSADELEAEEANFNLLWLLVPLVLILAWRLYFKERIARSGQGNKHRMKKDFFGKDSLFYRLTDQLEKSGYSRRQGETLYTWLERIEPEINKGKLIPALELHYRYRFDPAGLDPTLKNKLDNLVLEILGDIKAT